MKYLLASAALIFILSAPALATTKHVKLEGKSGSVEIKPGDFIAVDIACNETTPYRWLIDRMPKILQKHIRTRYVTNPNPKGMVGVPGTRTFILRSGAPGKGEVHFYESHVGSKEHTNEYVLHVTVKAKA